jgi:16S rRNA (cytidine1402-2'-O)-methyltransferase
MNSGTVYLIPVNISQDTQASVLVPSVLEVLPLIDYFLVENVRTARRYLSSLKIYPGIDQLSFEVLDKDTDPASLATLFIPVASGRNLGVMSESGCPGIADPGSLAVEYAHSHGIRVVPLVGPSSIILALMASGLNGQRFAFHGYLPVESKELGQSIREYERESKQKKQTQIFIETPYRNNSIMAALLQSLHDSTRLTVALDLTGKNESIQTRTIKKWKSVKIDFPKLPAVFLFLS